MEFFARLRRGGGDEPAVAPSLPFTALPDVNQRVTVWIAGHAPTPTRVEDSTSEGLVLASPNLALSESDAVSINWEDDDVWYTLDTRVVSLDDGRVPSVVVSREGRLSRREDRRKDMRVDVALPLELRSVAARVVKAGQELQTNTSELGTTALRFVTSSPLAPGDVLEAKVDLGDGDPVSVRIRVIRMDAVSGAWRQTCTAAYDEILSSDRERIQDFVQARTTGGNLSLHEF
jgi:hypothetical protein